jgi:hypothetical protein
MLAVVLFVIKWLGIWIGVEVGLGLLFVLCALFVPMQYHLWGSADRQTWHLKGHVSWLFHAVHISFSLSDTEKKHKIYIFGVPRAEKGEEEVPPVKTQEQETSADGKQEEETPVVRKQEQEAKKDTAFSKQKKGFSLSTRRRLGKIGKMKDKADRVTEMLRDDNTSQFFVLFRENLALLLRHLKPRRMKGWIHFGTSDPCTTGQILGGISILFAKWGRGIRVTPDFEEEILEGKAELQGSLQSIILLIAIRRVFFSEQWQHWKEQWDAIHV